MSRVFCGVEVDVHVGSILPNIPPFVEGFSLFNFLCTHIVEGDDNPEDEVTMVVEIISYVLLVTRYSFEEVFNGSR